MIILNTDILSEFMRPEPDSGVLKWLDAQVCAVHKATLATRNTKDFRHLPIELLNPWEL